MKSFARMICVAAVLGCTVPIAAQTTPKAEPATAPAAGKHYSTTDTTIGELLDDPAAKAVLDKYIPEVVANPQFSMAAAMTLRAIQPMAADKLPVEKLDAIDAELAKLPAK